MGEVWCLLRWQRFHSRPNLRLLSRSSSARDDRLQSEGDVSRRGGRRVRETRLRFLISSFLLVALSGDKPGNKEAETRESSGWDKSGTICCDFKLIKELVARWWGHLHMQVLTEREHYGGNRWKKDLKGALINVSAGVEGTLRRR